MDMYSIDMGIFFTEQLFSAVQFSVLHNAI